MPELLFICEQVLGTVAFFKDDEKGLDDAMKLIKKLFKRYKEKGFGEDSNNLTIWRVREGDIWDFNYSVPFEEVYQFDPEDDMDDDTN
ncbi:MAG: hypothetical protein Edafosvirus1_140 [Edafosvirus sp.]|uniref:Uncharacterized protein n=1 Tax=Edafosvirus sp. TaxID=2487765 RepID=A0A3G4ZWL0_9VIRU|nr:MAG: hypothetical protein Edafosvirus1_140 [Edafosvirus sp.]